MESYLRMCLILGVAAVLYSASIPHSSAPQQQRPVHNALEVYNEGLSSDGFLFGILQEDSDDLENIRFLIKETVCLKSAQKDEKCPFKEDGVVKMCTASLTESAGSRLEVSCQIVDISDNNFQAEENQKTKSVRHLHIFQLVQSGKKKLGTNFRQFDNKSSPDRQAVSCLSCIYDFLNPNTGG